MPPKSYYTDPKLRDQVKEEIKQSDKGGEPGQWSARKAQMMAQEYKKRGGGYTTDKSQQDEDQQNLEKWTQEEWQTKEGSGHAQKSDGTQKRYLPKKAWEKMTEEEKKATDEKKQEESKEGKQHVGNTAKAKEKRKQAEEPRTERRSTRSQSKNDNQSAQAEENDDDAEEEEKPKANTGQKRKSGQQSQATSKKQKKSDDGGNAPPGKVGSKHMDATEPAPRGSADRLPKKNQKVTWKAMPGYVDGTVQDILTKGKTVDGKSVKASKDDPKIVLKSSSSGKICVHKPESCFYE